MYTVRYAFWDNCSFYDLKNDKAEQYNSKEEAFYRKNELKKQHGSYVLVNIYKNSIKID